MKYVITQLAEPDKITTPQMGNMNLASGIEVYLQNSFVCLFSCLHYNHDIQCILMTSFELSDKWLKCFNEIGVKNIHVPFGKFKISNDFKWKITQYKYDIMYYVTHSQCFLPDDQIIILDTDVLCTGKLENVYEEARSHLLLFDIQHSLDHPDRYNIRNNYKLLYPNKKDDDYYLVHYGGEFIAGTVQLIKRFIDMSSEVIMRSIERTDLKDLNDENITSIAADLLFGEIKINPANAYIYRYWTGDNFYLTSTNWFFNKVVLWHLPSEKNYGLRHLFDVLQKNNHLPTNNQLAVLFGFPAPRRNHRLYHFLFLVIRKIKMIFRLS